ncbi:MAG: hypothetical protein ACXV6M_14305, partial [Ilumatobacteraceae bacterium]
MDLGTARSRLKTAIRNGLGDEFAVDDLRDNPNVPGAIVYPDAPIDWGETFDNPGALTRYKFCVLILVPYVDTDDAQTQLDAYLSSSGSSSITTAIEADTVFTVLELKSYGVMSLSE